MTREFERAFENGIPQHEAANFFLRIKHAGWTDAPDETGTLEGQFAAPIEQVIATVAEVAAAKFKLMVAYHIFAESMRGLAQHPIGEVFHEHAEMERAAAEAYLKRAAVLGGGPVHLPEIETPPASSDPIGIIMMLARAEQEAIALQTQLKQMVGEINPLGFQIEQFMIEDQHHLDELWQMLPQDMQHTPVIDQGAEGGMPPEAGAVPAEAAPEAPADPSAPVAEAAPEETPEPTPGQKEAFARALRKLAGIETELRGAMSDSDMEIQRKLNKMGPNVKADAANKVVGTLRDLNKDPLYTPPAASPKLSPLKEYELAHRINDGVGELSPEDAKILRDHMRAGGGAVFPGAKGPSASRPLGGGGRAVEDGVNSLMRNPKMLVGAGAAGALLGAARMSSAYSMMGSRNREKMKSRSGPIGRFTADHPGTVGAIQGAVSLPLAMAASSRYGLGGLVAGAAAPGVASYAVDRVLKAHEDRNAKMASAFRTGLQKLGFQPPEPGLGADPGAAPMPDTQQAVVPQPSMAQPGVQPMMATPPGQRQYAPVNYLEAEETARRVQEQNEAAFYKSKADEASGQVQSMGAQVQDIQAQLDQLSAQAAESQNQIMSANQEAVQANDQMLNQATLAARMRMGMQQLRAQMMEVASQDPEQLAAAAGGPTPMDVGAQAQQGAMGPAGAPAAGGDPSMGGAAPGDPSADPGAQPGTPAASPDPGAPPGSPPGGAGGPDGASASGDTQKSDGESPPAKKETGHETTVSIKKGSAKMADIYAETMGKLPFAAAGAAIGAGAGYLNAKRGAEIPSLRDKVDSLKGQQEGGFGKAIELGKTQVALGEAEQARQSPGRAALKGGLLGAGLGVGLGAAVPAGIEGGKRLLGNLRTVAGNMR